MMYYALHLLSRAKLAPPENPTSLHKANLSLNRGGGLFRICAFLPVLKLVLGKQTNHPRSKIYESLEPSREVLALSSIDFLVHDKTEMINRVITRCCVWDEYPA